jgi:hypothetical protein
MKTNKPLEALVDIIKSGAGTNPVVILDTGAVIHFEDRIRNYKSRDSSITATQWYSPLLSSLNVYVTESVIGEICRHHDSHVVNGNREICDETFEIVKQLHGKYCKFLKELVFGIKDFEKARYDVHNAGEIARILRARHHPKKAGKEGLSITDKEVLETALLLRYAGRSPDDLITSATVLGTDNLIKSTANLLCDEDRSASEEFGLFGYDNINAINVF